MEIKASWRILDPAKGDDTSRYYCRNALIYIDSNHTVNKKALYLRAKVGLVGMHIIRKTAKFGSMMIWSTFEHVDNTPDSPQEAQMNPKKKWSYYNPLCLNCLPNDTPAFQKGDDKRYRWDSTPPYGKRYAVRAPSQPALGLFGTQAVRTYPVYTYTALMSNAWQAKLKGTVWANYKLVGSQWQSGETIPAPNAPALLANTTLETFIQPTASCITCHGDAKLISGKDTVRTDLSFVFAFYPK
jgi:mono/diheme cytochrome c family protein